MMAALIPSGTTPPLLLVRIHVVNGGPQIPFGLFVSLSLCLLLPFHTRADTIYDLLFAIRRQGCCNTTTLPHTTT